MIQFKLRGFLQRRGFVDKISTGIKGFDDIMGGLYPGDNVVWQVEDINNYKYVANAFFLLKSQ